MAGARSALIVANDEYEDPRLRKLRAPAQDAEELGRVLGDPDIGGFEVEVVHNEPEAVVRRKIARFFANRKRDDLLLLHISSHGLKDDAGRLYFAAIDTEVDQLDATALWSEFVNRQMTSSRSQRIVLLLDCCYAGAFAHGMTARAGDAVQVKERFEGSGRAVLTASSAMEYSFEGDELSGEGRPSIFTSAVVRGLETGEADSDGDSWVSVDELYEFVHDRVQETTPNQTPGKWVFDVRGELYIAKSRYARADADMRAAPGGLPPELLAAVESPFAYVRVGAVHELTQLFAGTRPDLADAARVHLQELTDDDSRRVSEAAASALTASAASERAVFNWSAGSREVLQIRHESSGQALALSADGRLLAAGAHDDAPPRVWELPAGRELAPVAHDDDVWRVWGIALSAEGRVLATASSDNLARVWKLPERRELLRVSAPASVVNVALSADGAFLAMGSLDKNAWVWDVRDARELARVRHDDWVRDVATSPDGGVLATGSNDETARVWRVSDGHEIARVTHAGVVLGVELSSDAQLLATASADATARLWDISDGRELARVRHEDLVLGVALSDDGNLLATASRDGTSRLWELPKGREVLRVNHEEPVWGVGLSADGRVLVTGGEDGTIRVWEAVDT